MISLYIRKLHSSEDEWTNSTCNSTEKFYRHNVEWTSRTKMCKKLHGFTTINLKNIETDLAYWTSICDGYGYNFWDASNVLFLLAWFWVHTPMYFFLSHLSFSTSAGSDSNWTQNAGRFLCQEVSPLQWLLSAMLDLLHLHKVWVSEVGGDGPGWTLGQWQPRPLYIPMSSRVCTLLMVGEHTVGITDASGNTMLICCLCSFGSNEINHFCDGPARLLLYWWFSAQSVGDIHNSGLH